MIRFMPYIFPILVNYVLGGIFFITPLRCSQAAAPPWVVGATTATWAFVYSIVSYVIGTRVTPQNAVKLIVTGGLLISLSSLGFLIFSGVYTQFLWIVLTGIAVSIYCTSFQIFAKAVEKGKSSGVSKASALYTASWSIGMATGPFVFGLLSISASFIINAVIGLLIAAGIYLISRRIDLSDSAAIREPDLNAAAPQSSKPNIVYAGWILGGVGTIAIFVIRTLIPYRATLLGFSRTDAGLVMAAVSYTQAVIALFLLLSKDFMYRIYPVIIAGICSVASLLMLGFCEKFSLFFAAAVIFGCYSGYFYFMFVFHSLISPEKSTRYVAINEILVGITGIIGPLAGGLITTPETSGAAFPVTACLCTVSVLVVICYIIRKTNER